MTSVLAGEPPSSAGACRICGDDTRATGLGRIVNGYALYRCESCGTVFVTQKPDLKEVARTYDFFFSEGPYASHRAEWEKLKVGKKTPSFYRTSLLRRVERMVEGRRMIEIGGGSGAFGVLATKRGWEYVDLDISHTAIELARKLGLVTHRFEPDSLPPLDGHSADVVVMWEVIEHVWDVHGYLSAIRNALRSNGILLISTPNWLHRSYHVRDDWGPSKPPIHINFFTRDSLCKTLGAAGFSRNRVIQRRLYRRGAGSSWLESLKMALHIHEPETFYGISRGD